MMQAEQRDPWPTVIRLVPELRACHLERHALGTPARLLFLETNGDFGVRSLPEGVHKVSLAAALRILVSTSVSDIELPEPLWMRFLPRHALLSAAAKVGGLIRRRPRRLSTYAMENNDFARLVGGHRDLPAPVVGLAAFVIGAYTRIVFSRVAFASEGSRLLYHSLPFVSRVESTVVDELPAALPSDDALVVPSAAAFVGVLEERKGVTHLIRAWEIVERQRPDAVLSITGSGPLSGEIRSWAARSPRSRVIAGHESRETVLARLEHSAVLVAPSVPDGRWREQIGLPIKEGLSRGLTVVTTEQTGLAGWLAATGHHVVPLAQPSAFEKTLAATLLTALDAPLSRSAVRASLPGVDGRLRSDAWLHDSNIHLLAQSGSSR